MHWRISHRADPAAARIADRHYSRQKPGTPQFVPPGRCLVLAAPRAYWVTSWPFAEHVKHAWAGAWICSAFRNEGEALSSDLIRESDLYDDGGSLAAAIGGDPEVVDEPKAFHVWGGG